MRFFFDPDKATQAAAHLVTLHGGQINVMALLKLLYLADRQALLETGYPITGDCMVSMPHGPVLSRIYDAIKWGCLDFLIRKSDDPWASTFSERENNEILLSNPSPSTEKMSKYEIKLLNKIHEVYGKMTPWQLRNLTHKLPEWNDPHGSSSPIEPETILRHAGKSDQEIKEVVQEAEEVYFLSTLHTPSPVHL